MSTLWNDNEALLGQDVTRGSQAMTVLLELPAAAAPSHGQRQVSPPEGPATLPLRLDEPLHALLFKDRSLFDDKLTTHEEYRFGGLKGGFS